VGANPCVVTNHNVPADGGKWLNRDVLTDFGFWMYVPHVMAAAV
jgi:O-phosphoseryl-tRNA(Cys) synthetase